MKQTDIEENKSSLELSKNVKVSQKEIAKRRILHKHVLGSIGVGDSPINPKLVIYLMTLLKEGLPLLKK